VNLQARDDLEIEKDRLGKRLRRDVQVLVPAESERSGRTGWRLAAARPLGSNRKPQ